MVTNNDEALHEPNPLIPSFSPSGGEGARRAVEGDSLGSWSQCVSKKWRLPMNRPTPAPLPGGDLQTCNHCIQRSSPPGRGRGVGSWFRCAFKESWRPSHEPAGRAALMERGNRIRALFLITQICK
jgi:hypothetical protein